MTPRQAFFSPRERVPFARAVGRVSAAGPESGHRVVAAGDELEPSRDFTEQVVARFVAEGAATRLDLTWTVWNGDAGTTQTGSASALPAPCRAPPMAEAGTCRVLSPASTGTPADGAGPARQFFL